LPRVPEMFCTPGITTRDPEVYKPEDLIVGMEVDVFGRLLMLYDCDDFTRSFYRDWMQIEQGSDTPLDPPKPSVHLDFPPHSFEVGSEEDSLASCLSLRPKPPKKDIISLMQNAGKILRFEAKLEDAQIEDVDRRFIIGVYLTDNTVAVWELIERNSGFAGGAFAERTRRKNPDTKDWYKPADFTVGSVIVIKGFRLRILRADEYSLKEMELMGGEVCPMSDVSLVASKLRDLRPALQSRDLLTPEELREMAMKIANVELMDQELISLLRKCGTPAVGDTPSGILTAQLLQEMAQE